MRCTRCGTTQPDTLSACRRCGAPASGGLDRPWVITVLGVVHIFSGVALLAGAALLVWLGAKLGSAAELPLIGAAPMLLAAPIGIVALAYLFCGIGLLKLRSYGRTGLIVLSVLGLLAFPFGTAISVLTLIYVFSPGVKLLFSGRTAASFDAAEARDVEAARTSVIGRVLGVVMVIGMVLAIGWVTVAGGALVKATAGGSGGGQERTTMGDIRTVATAIESRSIDEDAYPKVTDIDGLVSLLEPTYVKTCPRTDGWGNPLRYELLLGGKLPSFAVSSAGSDGAWQHDSARDYGAGDGTVEGADIVFAEGSFIQAPGMETQSLAAAAERPSSSPRKPAPREDEYEPPAEGSPPQLHFLQWSMRTEGSQVVLEGLIANPAGTPLSEALAKVTFVDEKGRPISSGETPLETLAPQAQATFRVSVPLHPSVLTARVEFKDARGVDLVVIREEAAADPFPESPED